MSVYVSVYVSVYMYLTLFKERLPTRGMQFLAAITPYM